MEKSSSSGGLQDRAAYGELRADVRFIRKNEQLTQAIESIRESLNIACSEYKNYSSFTFEEKARYDGLITYSVNSLIWMFQKLTGGTDMMESIKDELGRVRSAMERTTEISESISERPRLNQPAAKRFISAGLHDPFKSGNTVETPPNKKKRFDEH